MGKPVAGVRKVEAREIAQKLSAYFRHLGEFFEPFGCFLLSFWSPFQKSF